MQDCQKFVKQLLRLAVVLFLLTLGVELCSHRVLFADGVNFLLHICEAQNFTYWDYPRQFAHYLTQAPMVAAMQLGVHNFPVITLLYGVGLLGIPLGTLGMCALLVPTTQRVYLLLIAVAMAYLALHTSLFIISESHAGVQLFFVVLCFLLFPEHNLPWWRSTLGCLGALAAVRVYESYFILGPFLAAVAVWRLRTATSRQQIACYVWVAGCGVISAIIGTRWMLFNPDRNVEKVGLGSILMGLAQDPNTLLSTAGLLALCILLLRPLSAYAPKAVAPLCCAAAGAGLLLGLAPWFVDGFLPVKLAYPGRILNIIVPLGVGALCVVCRRGWEVLSPRPGVLGLMTFLLCWNATWQVTASAQWRHYCDGVVKALAAAETPVLLLAQTPLRDNVWNWSWTLPSLSIALETLEGHAVHTLLVDDPHPPFQPFDPTRPADWPHLAAVGVRYKD